jgi:hypothetical protein
MERGPAGQEVDCGEQGVLDQEAVALLDAVDDRHNFGELAGAGEQRIDGFRRRYRPRYQLVGLVFPEPRFDVRQFQAHWIGTSSDSRR